MPAPQPTETLRRHAGLIGKVAYAYARNPVDRDELVQEIAVQLWRSQGRFDPRFAESTWVYRIALNTAITWFRRERRHRGRQAAVDVAEVATARPTEPPDPGEAVDRLRRGIDALGALDRALVLLHLEGRDHAAIGEVLGISTSNVGTRLSRVRARLRTVLAPGDAGAPGTTQREEDHGTR